MSLRDEMVTTGQRAREASYALGNLSTAVKNSALEGMAEALLLSAPGLKQANVLDLKAAKEEGLSSAMIDRLTLSDAVLMRMAASLKEIALLPDPVGEVNRMWTRPNGLT